MYCETEAVDLALSACEQGDEVVVTAMEFESPLSVRLRELGVLAGVPVRIARAGSPLIIEVGETRLCLRGSEGNGVRVRPLSAEWMPIALAEEAGLA